LASMLETETTRVSVPVEKSELLELSYFHLIAGRFLPGTVNFLGRGSGNGNLRRDRNSQRSSVKKSESRVAEQDTVEAQETPVYKELDVNTRSGNQLRMLQVQRPDFLSIFT